MEVLVGEASVTSWSDFVSKAKSFHNPIGNESGPIQLPPVEKYEARRGKEMEVRGVSFTMRTDASSTSLIASVDVDLSWTHGFPGLSEWPEHALGIVKTYDNTTGKTTVREAGDTDFKNAITAMDTFKK